MDVATISMCKTDLKDKILEVVTIEHHYAQIKKFLQQKNVQ